jgi:hypothetical protein
MRRILRVSFMESMSGSGLPMRLRTLNMTPEASILMRLIYDEFETKKDISSQEVYKDPMANGINADEPIWRPRQYFIKVFDM